MGSSGWKRGRNGGLLLFPGNLPPCTQVKNQGCALVDVSLRDSSASRPLSTPFQSFAVKSTREKLELVAAKCSPSPLLGTSHSRIPAGYRSNGHFVSAYRGNCSSSAEFSPPPQAISTEKPRAAPSPPLPSLSLAADDSSPHRASPAEPGSHLGCTAEQSIPKDPGAIPCIPGITKQCFPSPRLWHPACPGEDR